jgi:hypothetical protein
MAAQLQVHLGRPRVGAQDLAEPLHHRRDAPGHWHRHHERARIINRQVGNGQVHGDQLGHVIPAVDLTLHHHHGILGDRGGVQLVGLREEQHLDRAAQVLQGGGGPLVTLLGHLALNPGQDAAHLDDLRV